MISVSLCVTKNKKKLSKRKTNETENALRFNHNEYAHRKANFKPIYQIERETERNNIQCSSITTENALEFRFKVTLFRRNFETETQK